MSCPSCIAGEVLNGEPTGVNDAFQDAYFAAGKGTSTTAVILFSDIFGLPLKNCKLLADKFAKDLGCDVWVPDMFNGDPPFAVGSMKQPEAPGEKMTFWHWWSMFLALIPRAASLFRSRPAVVESRLVSFITALKEEKKYEKLGAVGYCYGGIMAVALGGTDLVNSVVICHPGAFPDRQLKALKVPASWACAEEDMTFVPSLRLASEAELEGRKGKDNYVDYEFKTYPGTTHGFAIRPNLKYNESKEGFEGAFSQAVSWFQKTIF